MKKFNLHVLVVLCFVVLNGKNCFSQVSNFVSVKNGKLHYRIYGEGQPILVINGGPGFNSNGFEFLGEKFAQMGYQAILFDQRGTGLSSLNKVNPTTITMDLMVEDIETIRKERGFKQWVLFGHSFGGMLASYYTAKHPEVVIGLILSSSGGLDLALLSNSQENLFKHLSQSDRDSIIYYRAQRNQNPNNPKIQQSYTQFMAKAYVKNQEFVPTVAKRLGESNMDINRMVWSNLREIEYDVKDEFKNFKKPVLILHGDEDIVPLQVAKEAENVFENSKLILLPNSRHYGWLDNPEVYFSEIKIILESISND